MERVFESEQCSSPRELFAIRQNTMGVVAFAPIRENPIAKPNTSIVVERFWVTRFAAIDAIRNDSSDQNGRDTINRGQEQDSAEKESGQGSVNAQKSSSYCDSKAVVTQRQETIQKSMTDSGLRSVNINEANSPTKK